MEDTICSISTSMGVGAISIIRISGSDAIKIVSKIFSNKKFTKASTHTVHYGFVMENNEKIDEVLVTLMLSPKTYTTEDVVEINCHGGISSTNKVLELLLKNGCRLAEPGEFTKRAFLNGRIDLIEAEAVGDLIKAKTESERKMFINKISGVMSEKIKKVRKEILEIMANIEVNIDYPEYEDAVIITEDIIKHKISNLKTQIEKILKDSENGRIIKNGIKTLILGKPNVGKSSILNSLLNEDKAIVTDIAGTTRDIVEGEIILNNIKLNIIDTAGLRKTDDIVERIGVEKSLKLIDEADLIIYVIDAVLGYDEEDVKIINNNKEKTIILINKTDLSINSFPKLNEYTIVYGNTKNNDGLDSLKKSIVDKFNFGEMELKDYTYLSNAREISELNICLQIVNDIIIGVNNGVPVDMLAIDIKRCWDTLGNIIGATYQDELLDELFSKFCLGK